MTYVSQEDRLKLSVYNTCFEIRTITTLSHFKTPKAVTHKISADPTHLNGTQNSRPEKAQNSVQ
jgi:hypothetical protein